MNSLRYAHTRRPAYTLRLCLLRHQTLETPFCRSYLSGPPPSRLDPNENPPTPASHPTPTRPHLRGAPGWAHGALVRHSAVHFECDRPFRVDSNSGWKARCEFMRQFRMARQPESEGATSANGRFVRIWPMGPLGVSRSFPNPKAIPKVRVIP